MSDNKDHNANSSPTSHFKLRQPSKSYSNFTHETLAPNNSLVQLKCPTTMLDNRINSNVDHTDFIVEMIKKKPSNQT
uniref:Uncharacterized protein n=1 Tax=Arion vulgaris TaxID=1028688 RepID=A0A0B7B9Z5_9EUPU